MVRTKVKAGKSKKKGELVAASKDAHRDVLPRTGLGAGATAIDSFSSFLGSYGKIIVPALLLLVASFAIYLVVSKISTGSEARLRNTIDQAAMVDTFEELSPSMEVAIAEAESEKSLVDYALYRYAVRAYQLLERPYKEAQLESAIGTIGNYLERFGDVERLEGWNRNARALHARLTSDLEFLRRDDSRQVLPWTHRSVADKPEPTLVGPTTDEDGNVIPAPNPVVVFVTSAGTLRIELFEDDAPNAVYHFVSLIMEDFFARTDASATSFSNSFSPLPHFRGATVISAGKVGRPAGVELELPTTADDDADEDTSPRENPYTIAYEGSPTRRFQAGSIALARDPDEPTRARTEFFVVIEPSDALAINFQPLGRVLDGDAGMEVARALHDAEIYYTYVERKREGVTYLPMVYYDGWPVPTRKRSEVPDPLRFSQIETRIHNERNPLVVIQLERGDIVIELFEDVTPNTVANFINLIMEGFYDQECSFYRVEGSGTNVAEIYEGQGPRIIQGGFSGSESREGYEYVIRNEAVDNPAYVAAGIANRRGTIAMARQTELDTASTEFFINLKDHPMWDDQDTPYCVFGEVIQGLDLAAYVEQGEAIIGAHVLRRRDREYVPEVRYDLDEGWVAKRPVEIPPATEGEDSEG
jgi:cyclophilin family peptidyl-prolyl cis-trans isomerase